MTDSIAHSHGDYIPQTRESTIYDSQKACQALCREAYELGRGLIGGGRGSGGKGPAEDDSIYEEGEGGSSGGIPFCPNPEDSEPDGPEAEPNDPPEFEMDPDAPDTPDSPDSPDSPADRGQEQPEDNSPDFPQLPELDPQNPSLVPLNRLKNGELEKSGELEIKPLWPKN
ncbi:MAG: hypothetical protein AB7W16_29095 [Candidatus Obscuribacterales bacterium]